MVIDVSAHTEEPEAANANRNHAAVTVRNLPDTLSKKTNGSGKALEVGIHSYHTALTGYMRLGGPLPHPDSHVAQAGRDVVAGSRDANRQAVLDL